MKEEIVHHWDDEIGDTDCGYLEEGELVSDKMSLVTCERCIKINEG